MSITLEQFRGAMRCLPAGVAIVTIRAGAAIHGLTVSAVVSVSPTPPLVAIVVGRGHRAHRLLEDDSAVFAVNILQQGQEELSDRFAWSSDDRFAVGQWGAAVTGAPILSNALAWVDCTVHARYPAGENTIVVGEVQASGAEEQRPYKPLVYWNRAYRTIC